MQFDDDETRRPFRGITRNYKAEPPPNDKIRQLVRGVIDKCPEDWGPKRIQAALKRQGSDIKLEVIVGVLKGL